jgi:hypothetical protein
VLVGPNNAGKSTVLDALLIGAHPVPRDAIRQVVARRGLERGARWLFWRSGNRASAAAKTSAGFQRKLTLERQPDVGGTVIRFEIEGTAGTSTDFLRLDDTNQLTHGNDILHSQLDQVAAVHLVEPHRGLVQEPLHWVYTRALEQGRADEVNALLGGLLPGFRRVEILADRDTPVVYVTYKEGSVPAALQGDGVQAILHLSLELAAAPDGVVLLEEPETAQHPRALFQSARAIAAAVKRGVQVVLSTHSLELVDALRTHLGDDLPMLTLHHLANQDGELSAVRYAGPEVALARDTIGEDLR